jgi:DNA-binding response OmpR family regulator
LTKDKLKILFVDDEPDIVNVMKYALEHKGFHVDAFTDPQEALDHFKPDYYDDVILDIKMEKINGFDLARRIWQQDNDAKICFLSAFEIYENEVRDVFTHVHRFCFIKKPVTVDFLVNHIKEHLS